MKQSDTNNGMISIDMFNKLTRQETLHPLVTLADLSDDELTDDLYMPCNFYALICKLEEKNAENALKTYLRLINPGEMFEIPSFKHCQTSGYFGVLFSPDLLCDTPLEHCIDNYPVCCSCHSTLSKSELQKITNSLKEIRKELHHAIDPHSSTIIVSHIELLLNYCTRFCSHEKS